MSISFWLVLLLFPALFILVFVGVTLEISFKRREKAWLEKYGAQIVATVVRVQPLKESPLFYKQARVISSVRAMQPGFSNQTQRYYELWAEWISPQSGHRSLFKRRYYRSGQNHYALGEHVTVLVDMARPHRYLIVLHTTS
jgi:hypothetical protein